MSVPAVVVAPRSIVPFAIVKGAPRLLFALGAGEVTLLMEATLKAPLPITVLPLKVLLPDKIIVPVPVLVSVPVPLMMPEKVVDPLLPPVVSAPAPSVTLPAPASEPMVSVWPLTLNSAPLATVRAEVSGILSIALTPSCSVPELIVVVPT